MENIELNYLFSQDYKRGMDAFEHNFESNYEDIYKWECVLPYISHKYMIEPPLTLKSTDCIISKAVNKRNGDKVVQSKHITKNKYDQFIRHEWDKVISLKYTNMDIGFIANSFRDYNETTINDTIKKSLQLINNKKYYNKDRFNGIKTNQNITPSNLVFEKISDTEVIDQNGHIFKYKNMEPHMAEWMRSRGKPDYIINGVSNPDIGKYYDECEHLRSMFASDKIRMVDNFGGDNIKDGSNAGIIKSPEMIASKKIISDLKYEIHMYHYGENFPKCSDDTIIQYANEKTRMLKAIAQLGLLTTEIRWNTKDQSFNKYLVNSYKKFRSIDANNRKGAVERYEMKVRSIASKEFRIIEQELLSGGVKEWSDLVDYLAASVQSINEIAKFYDSLLEAKLEWDYHYEELLISRFNKEKSMILNDPDNHFDNLSDEEAIDIFNRQLIRNINPRLKQPLYNPKYYIDLKRNPSMKHKAPNNYKEFFSYILIEDMKSLLYGVSDVKNKIVGPLFTTDLDLVYTLNYELYDLILSRMNKKSYYELLEWLYTKSIPAHFIVFYDALQ